MIFFHFLENNFLCYILDNFLAYKEKSFNFLKSREQMYLSWWSIAVKTVTKATLMKESI